MDDDILKEIAGVPLEELPEPAEHCEGQYRVDEDEQEPSLFRREFCPACRYGKPVEWKKSYTFSSWHESEGPKEEAPIEIWTAVYHEDQQLPSLKIKRLKDLQRKNK